VKRIGFDRNVEVVRGKDCCNACYVGNEGKKRAALDIIPSTIQEEDLVEYIADLCHECATPKQSEVYLLE